ncbi:hypothetical protein [Haloarcula salina]|uniref:Uncharacterized protein n=1 Tax=Haloarcula salina TaxID=1429914 RepID=A0AA41FYV8_9EURY|nr:hypothetical protein [Haloarcula salina]MBV0900183.1 hypothetical protein [Haloarcula salina]
MRSSVQSILLMGFGFIFIITGGFLFTQLSTISSGHVRPRVLIAGLISVVLGGVFLYTLVDA